MTNQVLVLVGGLAAVLAAVSGVAGYYMCLARWRRGRVRYWQDAARHWQQRAEGRHERHRAPRHERVRVVPPEAPGRHAATDATTVTMTAVTEGGRP